MLLQNAEQTASFSPLDVLVNWGFSMNQAVPSLYADLLQPPELTNALHEFTHQHAMFSEMGLWFLHKFWKFLAQGMKGHFGLTLMIRDRLWDAWWLTSFLLEGHATYAQLHLYPSSQTDAACPQHTFLHGLGLHTTFIRPKATDLTSFVQEMNEETARLFRAASRDAHGIGLKYKLLLSNQDWAQPYLLGYVFFRSAQRFLAHFDARFRDPEIFFIFISELVFNNCFQTLAGTDLFAPAADELFLRIVAAIKEVAPASSMLLEPILRHPTGPVHFLAVDYIASARQGRLIERPELDRSLRIRAEDIAKLDDYMGSTFLESALSFQFVHLKSINARIVSLAHEINTAPFLVLLSESETREGTTLRLGGMQIANTGAERIRQFVLRKGGRLIERCSIQLRIHDLIDQLDEFSQCEIHVIMPINSPRVLTYIATEEEFVLMEDYQPITGVADEDPEEIARRGYGRSYRMKLAEQANESYHMLIDYLQQSSFIRSRQCRQKVSTYFLALLAQWEEEFYNHMTTWKELHDPKKVEERSRADMTRLFRRALWQSDESNPIGEVIHTCSALAEFERFCSVSPVASGAYEPPTLTPELNDELALVFAQNVFFRKSGIALRGDEIL